MSTRPHDHNPARTARARKLGDDLIALLKEHEDEHHGGERCPAETINTLAFLCHVSGIHLNPIAGDDALVEFRDLVARTADYNAIHHEHHVE